MDWCSFFYSFLFFLTFARQLPGFYLEKGANIFTCNKNKLNKRRCQPFFSVSCLKEFPAWVAVPCATLRDASYNARGHAGFFLPVPVSLMRSLILGCIPLHTFHLASFDTPVTPRGADRWGKPSSHQRELPSCGKG